MGQPIEEAAKQALNVNDSPSGVDYFGADVHGNHASVSVGYKISDVVPDLLRAQTEFITAQHAFMHSQDLSALVEAQRKYADVQRHCIVLLDTGVLAGINEQTIGLHTEALRKLGVI